MTQKTRNVVNRPWWDFWVAAFALAAITLMAARLWATNWTDDLTILVASTFVAGVAGLALGYSQFPAAIAALFSAVYGAFTIGWLYGATLDMELSWYDRMINDLGWRLANAIQQFGAGQTVTDPILFLTMMATVLWVIASASAFILIRRGAVWAAALPLGLTLLIFSHYDPDLSLNTRFLIFFLFFVLMIIGRMAFLRNRLRWAREDVHPTPETKLDISKTLLTLVTTLLIVAWLIPLTPTQVHRYSALWDTLTEPWDRFSDSFSNLFVANTRLTTPSSSYFGETLPLGSGAPVDEKVALTVQHEGEQLPGYRHYWRARSYDRYDDAVWTSTAGLTKERLFPDDPAITYPAWDYDQHSNYTFTSGMERMINLYTTGVPTAISRPVDALLQPIGKAEADLVALMAEPNLSREESYQITTRLSMPTETDLRQAQAVNPPWLGRYLQLPKDFSPKIQALADEITRDSATAYDQAVAITQYLRETIDYSRALPPIPEDVNPLEWFLFDQQVGFCNYYATAEVLMLRSLGVPARLAAGYAEGDYDEDTGTYTARKDDSHAWPEVYFVGFGWIAFEPTVSQRALARPSGDNASGLTATSPPGGDNRAFEDLPNPDAQIPRGILSDTEVEALLDTASDRQPQSRISSASVPLAILSIVLLLLGIGLLLFIHPAWFNLTPSPLPVILERYLIRKKRPVPNWLTRWRCRAQRSPSARAYRQVGRAMRVLGQPPLAHQTPQERATILIGLLPEAQVPIRAILSEYQLDQFSDHLVNEDRARDAARQVRTMAFKARFRRMVSFGKQH